MTAVLRELPVILVKGFCMGAADVVPGVSGGTMAFILGIYTRLIDAIKSFDAIWLQAIIRFDLRTAVSRPHLPFLLPLLGGIFLAVVFFTKVVPIPRLLHTHPEHIYGFFFGLIVGSTFVLVRRIGWHSVTDGAALIVGLLLGGIVVTAVPTQTPDAWWYIFGSGAVAICAMILPGISGSFILLILGKYGYILDGIGSLQFNIIIPFAAGAALGLTAFTRILSWLLHRFEHVMLWAISGFLVASLWVIWPFQDRVYTIVREKQRLIESHPITPPFNTLTIEVAALVALGIVCVLLAHHFASFKKR